MESHDTFWKLINNAFDVYVGFKIVFEISHILIELFGLECYWKRRKDICNYFPFILNSAMNAMAQGRIL